MKLTIQIDMDTFEEHCCDYAVMRILMDLHSEIQSEINQVGADGELILISENVLMVGWYRSITDHAGNRVGEAKVT